MSALLVRSRMACGLCLLLFAAAFQAEARSLPEFTELVKENSPSVVNISTKQSKSVHNRFRHNFSLPDLPEDSPLNEFFQRFFGEGGEGNGGESPREYDAQSLGSGFIISEDGYILTAAHVVDGADEVLVRLSDRREFVAEIVGADKRSDVALLKIDAKDLPKVAKIGSSEALEVGEWMLAIGSPFGFEHSATAGIVSAKRRSLPSENYVPFIQTDVAINPGNSGGPLFNLDGEVVGINSQIYSRTGGFMGLSFAIPIDMAMNVSDQLRTKGRVSRGWLGVLIQDVTRELADSFGMPHPKGALVAKILPDSPAEKAGIQVGDVILAYNGKSISSSSALPPLVGSSDIDRPAKVEILRAGKIRTLKVDIGELPEEEALQKASARPNKTGEEFYGLTVTNITAEAREQLGLGQDAGVLVTEVRSGVAQAAGVKQGDVIQMINNSRVSSVEEFERELKKVPKGKSTPLLVLRKSGPIFLALRVPKE